MLNSTSMMNTTRYSTLNVVTLPLRLVSSFKCGSADSSFFLSKSGPTKTLLSGPELVWILRLNARYPAFSSLASSAFTFFSWRKLPSWITQPASSSAASLFVSTTVWLASLSSSSKALTAGALATVASSEVPLSSAPEETGSSSNAVSSSISTAGTAAFATRSDGKDSGSTMGFLGGLAGTETKGSLFVCFCHQESLVKI